MPRLRIATLTALVALVALAAACAPGAHAARGMEVAIQDDPLFLYRDLPPGVSLDDAMAYAKKLHVTWIRVNMAWNHVLLASQVNARKAPRKPSYQWGAWDALVADAARNHIHVEFVVMGAAPAYATANHKAGVYKPSAKLFGQFVTAVAKHFYPRVTRYSIWNEPNFVGFLGPKSQQASLYRGLYQAAYASLRRYARKAQVLMGETAPDVDGRFTAPLAFLRGVTCVDSRYRSRNRHCPRLTADGYAIHPYNYNHGPTYTRVGRDDVTIGTLGHLTAALDKLRRLGALRTPRGGAMPVYLTEFGYLAKRSTHQRAWPESSRSRWIPQAFGIAQRNSRVRQMLQYELFAPPCPSSWCFWDTALITRTGQRRATFTALQKWADGEARRRLIATR